MALTSALSMRNAIEAQQSAGFAWLAVAFGVGIALYFALKTEPSFGAILMVFGASGMMALLLWSRRDERLIAFAAALMLAFFAFGFAVAQLRAAIVHTPMIVKETGPMMVAGTIRVIDMMGEGGDVRVILSDLALEDIAPADTPKRIRLRVRDGVMLKPGQRIEGLASLHPPSPPVAPGAFDFQRMAYFESIGAVGFFYRAPEVIGQIPVRGYLGVIENWRLAIAARVSKSYNQPQAGLMIALLTGQQRAVAEDDYQALRDSGLAHLLAISGMNVAMIAATLFFLSRLLMAAVPWFALRFPIKKIAAVLAFFGALIYTMVAGMNVPTQRAILMTGIVLLAICLDRSPFSLRLLAFATFVILLFTPENVMGVSFQMSFSAVAALIVFYEWARPFWTAAYSRAGWLRRGALYLLGVIVTTLIGGTITGLFALYHFQTFALFNVLSNILAVPLTGVVIMPAAVAAMATMPLGFEGVFLDIMAWGVTWMLAIARWVAGLDGAVIRAPAFAPWIFLSITTALVFFLLWQGRARWAGLAVIAVLLCLIPFTRTPDGFVNSEASLVAVKNAAGDLIFSQGRGDSYAAETWLRRNGAIESQKREVWPKDGARDDLRCDALACRYEHNGWRVSILRSHRAMPEECAWAQVVIASFPVDQDFCSIPRVIDRFSVWRHGAQALYLDLGRLTIRRVEDERGVRPWTQTAARKKDQ